MFKVCFHLQVITFHCCFFSFRCVSQINRVVLLLTLGREFHDGGRKEGNIIVGRTMGDQYAGLLGCSEQTMIFFFLKGAEKLPSAVKRVSLMSFSCTLRNVWSVPAGTHGLSFINTVIFDCGDGDEATCRAHLLYVVRRSCVVQHRRSLQHPHCDLHFMTYVLKIHSSIFGALPQLSVAERSTFLDERWDSRNGFSMKHD